MDIDNLTREGFIDLVDKMLDIVYRDDNNNNNNNTIKINELIKLFCIKDISINKKITINTKTQKSKMNKNKLEKILIESKIYKIYPCNKKSLITENISLLNIDKSENKDGSLAVIHKKIIPGKIFKKSKNSDITTLFSMLFDCLLYKYAKQPNYLCKVDEIGKYNYDVVTIFYSIMDDCGKNLHDFFMKIKTTYIDNKNLSPNQIKLLFHNVLIIFYKMIEGVKILFDLGYAHLDVKPANFVISCIDSSINIFLHILDNNFINLVSVRIIDFGTIRKLNHQITITEIIGSLNYTHKDLIEDISNENPKNINIEIKHDIYSLGRSFAEIIMMLFTNIPKKEYFNDNLNINNYLNKIRNKLSDEKSSGNFTSKIFENIYDNYLKNILKKILNCTYDNINILMKELLTVIFVVLHENINNKIFLKNYKTQIEDNEDNEDNFTDTFKYYSSIVQLDIRLNHHIDKERYRKLYKLYVSTYLINKENKNVVDLKLNEYLNKIMDKYLLKIHDVGYQYDKDSLTYFRITENMNGYISLKDYFNNIVENIDMSNPVIQYKLLSRILYVFSLIMNCIQLIIYFDGYTLEVSLDNFIINNNGNLDNEDTINVKVTNGIQYNGLNTKPIQTLGYLLFRVLYKCFGYINQTSVLLNKIRKSVGTEKVKKAITNNSNKVTEINKNQRKISSILSVVKIKEVYLKDLAKIIKTMIYGNINIDDLISIFSEFRKIIYLNEIFSKYTEISSYSEKIAKIREDDNECNRYFIIIESESSKMLYRLRKKIYTTQKIYKGDYKITNTKGIYDKEGNNQQNIILKITDKNQNELNGNVFGLLLYNYIEYFYPSQLIHLCKIHEIGTIRSTSKSPEYYYSIIDKYGVNLNEFFKKNDEEFNMKFLYNILIIFYEMMECIEIIHDLGFLYLNIKPTNFLLNTLKRKNINSEILNISTQSHQNITSLLLEVKSKLISFYNIKITDFSNVRKIGSTTREYIGDMRYIPSDWAKYEKQKIKISGFELKIHHDIFSLGCIFSDLLIKLCYDNNIVGDNSYIIFPLIFQLPPDKDIIDLRAKFNEDYLNNTIDDIKNNLKQNFTVKSSSSSSSSKNNDKINEIIDKLMNIIRKMVDPDPEKRYQDIHKLMIDFGYLISDISKTFENEPNIKEHIKSFNNGKYKVFYDGKSLAYIEYEGKKYPIYRSYLPKLLNENNSELKNFILNKNSSIYKDIENKLKNNIYISNNKLYIKNKNNNIIGKIPIEYIITEKLTIKQIQNIISGNIESNNNNSTNNISINFGLDSIFSNLVKIYCYSEISNSLNNKYKDLYLETFNKYRYNDKKEELFILESIYLLLNDLKDNNILEDNQITTLIDDLSSIKYNQYEDGLILIPYDKLKSGNNYFYSRDNDTTIFYLGKLIDIKYTLMNKITKKFPISFTFKYNGKDIFGDSEISKDKFTGLKLFEIKQNTNNGKKQTSLGRINNSSSKNKDKGMFSRIGNSVGSVFGKIENYDMSYGNIDNLDDVNIWVTNYCKLNGIVIGSFETIGVADEFSAERFHDFKGTKIYDAGAGKNDCLIRSLLYSMSESYRHCDEGGRNKIASYFRRAFLPYFFDINRQYFFDIYKSVKNNKRLFFEENGVLFIRDNGKTNLNNLLGSSSFLPQIIAELLCKKLNVNLLIFTPALVYGGRINPNIQTYTPTLLNDCNDVNSNKLISICGNNTHFRSCKISYNKELSFIIDCKCETIEIIVRNIFNNQVSLVKRNKQEQSKA